MYILYLFSAGLCPLNPPGLALATILVPLHTSPSYLIPQARRMFKATLSLAKDASTIPSTTQLNRFKAQKVWPPDFTKLNPKQQFRFERRYRRRTKLKYTRPGWIKGVKLTSWVACTCMAVLFQLWVRRNC